MQHLLNGDVRRWKKFNGLASLSALRTGQSSNVTSTSGSPTTTTSSETHSSSPSLPSRITSSAKGSSTVHSSTNVPPAPTRTTATATPPPPPPSPTANSDFWDKGWGWKFEVYNIRWWSTDHGARLHKEENGCGALTGWSWTDDVNGSGGQAYFNLPFFIKDGGVERAVVSAGGPKLCCKGHSLFSQKAVVSTTFSGKQVESPRVGLAAAGLSAVDSPPLYHYDLPPDTFNHSYIPMNWSTESYWRKWCTVYGLVDLEEN